MREILFRGKRIDNGEWIEGYYVRLYGSNGRVSRRIYTPYAEVDCGDYYPDFFDVQPSTVGQYTGLCDKNGKKIFEGDIVTFPWEGLGLYRFVMKWDERCASFCAYPVKKSADVWPIGMFGYEERMEIIGNIHDNPELLEVSHE